MFYPMKPPSESPVGSVSSNGEKFLSPLLASHLTKIKPEQTKCFSVFELSSLLLRCVVMSTALAQVLERLWKLQELQEKLKWLLTFVCVYYSTVHDLILNSCKNLKVICLMYDVQECYVSPNILLSCFPPPSKKLWK